MPILHKSALRMSKRTIIINKVDSDQRIKINFNFVKSMFLVLENNRAEEEKINTITTQEYNMKTPTHRLLSLSHQCPNTTRGSLERGKLSNFIMSCKFILEIES
jgi:hypothetical protein